MSVLRSTRADFKWRDFRTLSFGTSHLFHSVSRLQHSGKIGVLVSMVLFHTLVSVISLFSGYSVTLSRDLRDVDVGVLACTH